MGTKLRKPPRISRVRKLYLDLLEALYERNDIVDSKRFADRLESLVVTDASFAGSIFLDEIRSLIAEARGDLGEAIRCREREIRKLFELHTLSVGTPGQDYVLREYDHSDVSDRLDILASLYAEQGDLGQAIETLKDSKRYCAAHEIPFDGEEMLTELEKERASSFVRNGRRQKQS
jgi:hypothetical protein